MKVSKHISTIFLVSSFSCILLFGLIFWIYSNSDIKTLSLLKEALSTTSGFFGGISTLVAAYVASQLFNDWRVEKKYELIKEKSNNLLIAIYACKSNLEKLAVYVYTYPNLKDKNEYDFFLKTTSEIVFEYQEIIINLKTHLAIHGKVIGKDKLLSDDDLLEINSGFSALSIASEIILKNFKLSANNQISIAKKYQRF